MYTDVYELKAIHSQQKSFGGKAQVLVCDLPGKWSRTLQSYDTKVAKITRDPSGQKVAVVDMTTLSATTLKHVKEFLLQNGLSAADRAQIIRLYS